MKRSPHEGGKSPKTPRLATWQAHKASRKPWLPRSGQKAGQEVLQLERGKRAAGETEFSSGKERSLLPAPSRLLMFFKKPQQSNSSSFPTTTPSNKKAQVCRTLRETNVSTSLENTPEACGHPAFLRRLRASSPTCLPSRAAGSGARRPRRSAAPLTAPTYPLRARAGAPTSLKPVRSPVLCCSCSGDDCSGEQKQHLYHAAFSAIFIQRTAPCLKCCQADL